MSFIRRHFSMITNSSSNCRGMNRQKPPSRSLSTRTTQPATMSNNRPRSSSNESDRSRRSSTNSWRVSTITNLIDMEFCLVCAQIPTYGKLLNCDHVICEGCLRHYCGLYCAMIYNEDEQFLRCPICQNMTVLTSGLSGLPLALPDNLDDSKKILFSSEIAKKCDVCIVKYQITPPSSSPTYLGNEQLAITIISSSSTTTTTMDDVLAPTAEYFCMKCCLYLCDNCKSIHCKCIVFRDHSIVHISNKDIFTTICPFHNRRDSTWYCINCKCSVCSICVLIDHDDHRVIKLTEALDQNRDVLRSRLDTIVYQQSTLKKRMEEFEQRRSPDNGLVKECKELFEKNERLISLAVNLLEQPQSLKLLCIYNDISNRFKSIIDFEISQLHLAIDNLLTPLSDKAPPFSPDVVQQSGTIRKVSHEPLVRTASNNNNNNNALYKPEMVWRLEKLRTDSTDLWNPYDIAWFDDDRLIMVDYETAMNSKLRVFDISEEKELGILGSSDIRPLGVCVTRDKHIAITDSKEKKIKILTPDGIVVESWGKGHFGWPYGIVVDSRGHFVVSDAFSDTVSVHTPDGKQKLVVGTGKCPSNWLRNPYYVAVDKRDNIVVCDSGNNRMKIFDISSGRLITTIKKTTISMSATTTAAATTTTTTHHTHKAYCKLKNPRGVCVDFKSGHILVVDDYSRICMFDNNYEYVRNLLTEQDRIKFPEALDINSYGQLAVTESSSANMCALTIFSIYA